MATHCRRSHGQRSLAGYSPWGRKESDTTEQLNSDNKNKKNPYIMRYKTTKMKKIGEGNTMNLLLTVLN